MQVTRSSVKAVTAAVAADDDKMIAVVSNFSN
jgi:hypothetical protein